MKLGRCELKNFGSYDSLSLDFSDAGLSLIQGPTGSGKSTIPDGPCWVLTGKTAKDGSVDEVRSWQSPDQPTVGSLEVHTPAGGLVIIRTRGKPTENDLVWYLGDDPTPRRGKDINDTQKLLFAELGVDYDLYATASYFSEFAPVAAFFTSKSKDRRATLEKIASLELPAKIAAGASDARKVSKNALSSAEGSLKNNRGKLEQLQVARDNAERDAAEWFKFHKAQIEALVVKASAFDSDKRTRVTKLKSLSSSFAADKEASIASLCASIMSLEDSVTPPSEYLDKIKALRAASVCAHCGGPTEENSRTIDSLREKKIANDVTIKTIETKKMMLAREQASKNPHSSALLMSETEINTFKEQAEQAEKVANPHLRAIARIAGDIRTLTQAVKDCNDEVTKQKAEVSSLTSLYDLSTVLRGSLLASAVSAVEKETNRLLDAYFDAELRVSFTLDADNLEVSIQKSGYDCVYRQLSKGQRGLLKLCFSVAVMSSASNRSGVHFDTLFFDEALDGLDSSLKVKAFNLFEELSLTHGSIFLIDHAVEFQNLFNTKYEVTMEGDRSAVLHS
jgi:DNA repair exonuclease SbcCD ATPase subunit